MPHFCLTNQCHMVWKGRSFESRRWFCSDWISSPSPSWPLKIFHAKSLFSFQEHRNVLTWISGKHNHLSQSVIHLPGWDSESLLVFIHCAKVKAPLKWHGCTCGWTRACEPSPRWAVRSLTVNPGDSVWSQELVRIMAIREFWNQNPHFNSSDDMNVPARLRCISWEKQLNF